MIQTLGLNDPPPPVRAMSYLDGSMILLDAYKYLCDRDRMIADSDALDILVRCHVDISDAYDAALRRNDW